MGWFSVFWVNKNVLVCERICKNHRYIEIKQVPGTSYQNIIMVSTTIFSHLDLIFTVVTVFMVLRMETISRRISGLIIKRLLSKIKS